MDLSVFEKFALQQIVEREQAESRALATEQAKRFNDFVRMLASEHNVPLEFLRYDPQTQTFSDARVVAVESAGVEAIETDVGDIATVA